jgi:hypothetical protein
MASAMNIALSGLHKDDQGANPLQSQSEFLGAAGNKEWCESNTAKQNALETAEDKTEMLLLEIVLP